MKKTLKNSLCLLLAAVMLVCAAPVFAAKSSKPEFEYEIINGEAEIIGLKEELPEDFGGTLVIPAEADGAAVTSVSSSAFYGIEEITDVVLPSGLKEIGGSAFEGTAYFLDESKRENGALYCGEYLLHYDSLAEKSDFKVKDGTVLIANYACSDNYAMQTLTVPESVKYIGSGAFMACDNLADVALPGSLEKIGANVFYGTALPANEKYTFNNALYVGKYLLQTDLFEANIEDYYIKEGTELIADGVFDYSYATMVTLPASVRSIGDYCFNNTPYLKKIAVDGSSPYFFNDANGVLYTKDMKTLICYPDAKPNASYDIPASVEVIADYAFSHASNLKSMVIPSSVKAVYRDSFANCGIRNLEVNGPEVIHDWVFFYCPLESLVIGEGVRIIEECAFSSEVITEIELPASVEKAECFIRFYFPLLEKITVSKDNPHLTSVDGVLYTKDMKTLVRYPGAKSGEKYTVPDGVEVIGANAFDRTPLCEITVADSVRVIEKGAFSYNENLEKVNFGSGLEIIGEEAFEGLNVNAPVVLPEGVKSIGDRAFAGSVITAITLPSTLESIGDDVFRYCICLEEINVASGNVNFKSVDGVLYNADMTELLAYPAASGKTQFVIPSTVSKIQNEAFAYSSLEEVTLPSSLRSVPQDLFYCSEYLTKVVIPEGVETIESWAFAECVNLEEVVFPSTLRCIEDRAFLFCTSLTGIDIPKNVSQMSGTSFEYCYSLESITAQEGGSFVAEDGILFTKDKKTLVLYPAAKEGDKYEIPQGVEKIGDCAFEVNINLKEVVIPEGVKEIGYDAFYAAQNLSTICVPASVEKIGDWAFYVDSATLSIYFAGSQEEWYALEYQGDFYPTEAYVAVNQSGPNLFDRIEQAFIDFILMIRAFWQSILGGILDY